MQDCLGGLRPQIETMTAGGVKRRRAVALILSGVFPGLGQFYNRQPIKGLLFLGVSVVLIWVLAQATPADPLALIERGATSLGVPLLAFLAIALWSVLDAWRSAGR